MEGQGAQAQKVSNSSLINTPNENYVIIFRDDSNGDYWAKLPDGSIEPLNSSVGAGDWKYNGNAVPSEKSIGTVNNFDFPVIVNNTESARFKTNGNLKLINNIEDNSGQVSIRPTTRQLEVGGKVTLDWNLCILYDTTPKKSIDWLNRIGYDSTENPLFYWSNGNFGINQSGPTSKLQVTGVDNLSTTSGVKFEKSRSDLFCRIF